MRGEAIFEWKGDFAMYHPRKIKSLLQRLEVLEKSAIDLETENKKLLRTIHPDHLASAKNLLHYLALRVEDLRILQQDLSDLALSSVGHAEAHVLGSLRKIKYLLSSLAGIKLKHGDDTFQDFKESRMLLKRNSADLLGKMSFQGQTKVMVTLPTEAGDDYEMVRGLVNSGMNIARINTAHDNPLVWKKMVWHVKRAGRAAGKEIKIYMDLEGPKIRTGLIKPGVRSGNADKPFILLFPGTRLALMKAKTLGQGGEHPFVSLSLPEIFGQVRRNESVWFDDGKIGGVIRSASADRIMVEITRAPEQGAKLRAEKGINFPDSDLVVRALTRSDLANLPFVAKYADMVGYSFVQKPEDVRQLQERLKKLNREDLGIILKIETHLAFENLPSLIFEGMRSRRCGVMIARGDLAVALGYLRVAEVQEEILWLAEAAHLPVIWATQVLETLVKKGTATRAEISDVVKSARAECVMLNKGPYIHEAIGTIKDIDKRMAAHEDKKRKMLRSLHVAKAFVN